MSRFLMVVVVEMVVMVVGNPISKCERVDQLVADKDSCTRYHICTATEEENSYVTQIATCAEGFLYDLVNSECIQQNKGYVQDPEGCNTFYGCHRPVGGGEGLIRRHYRCPGDLRFHPKDKVCTYKIFVPDALCAKHRPSETNPGPKSPVIAFSTPTTTPTTTSPPPPTTPPSTTTTTSTTTTPTPETTITTTTAATTATTPVTIDTEEGIDSDSTTMKPVPARPAVGDVSDLERITRVIKDQLLQRSKVAALAHASAAFRDK